MNPEKPSDEVRKTLDEVFGTNDYFVEYKEIGGLFYWVIFDEHLEDIGFAVEGRRDRGESEQDLIRFLKEDQF